MKSIIKTAILALILCATIMSGCIGSDDTSDSVTNANDEPDTSIVSDIIDKVSGSDSNEIPFTITMPMGDLTYFFVFKEDGEGEQCASWAGEVSNCLPMEWERTSDGQYTFIFDGGDLVSVTLLGNGVAVLESDGVYHTGEPYESREGTWESGVNR